MGTLSTAIKEWLELEKKYDVKTGTYDRLVISYKLMLHYGIARIPLESVTASDVKGYLNSLVEAGYSLSTIKKQYRLLTGFYAWAFDRGVITVNVTTGVKLPKEEKVQKHAREIVAYTMPQQKALLNTLHTFRDPACMTAEFMLETGLRAGEVIALSWEDVDWARRAVSISKTAVRYQSSSGLFIQPSPKSKASKRTIPLNSRAMAILSELYSQADDPGGPVFHDDSGKVFTYEHCRWRIMNACKQAGVPFYGLHAFRHTFATNCYNRGCDVKLLSRILGHASAAITYNIYIHLYGDALEEMRSVVG